MADDLKWRRIAESIAADIRSGRQPVGSKLPIPERASMQFDADPNTVRVAYRFLRELGVLKTSPRGTFVAQEPPDDLPEPRRVSPLERRLNARIDELAARVARLERERPPAE